MNYTALLHFRELCRCLLYLSVIRFLFAVKSTSQMNLQELNEYVYFSLHDESNKWFNFRCRPIGYPRNVATTKLSINRIRPNSIKAYQ